MRTLMTPLWGCLLMMSLCSGARAQELPDWAGKIRPDHPRLFLNADTWPQVKARALGAESAWYERIKRNVDRLAAQAAKADALPTKEYGPQAAQAAFVYLMTGDADYKEAAEKCLDASIRFYEDCYENRKSVNWYSTSRVHATMAWDWLYNDLSPDKREEYMGRLIRVIKKVLDVRPRIYRENYSGYTTGFYGVHNCLWFIGCTALGTGIEEELVGEWLTWGREQNLKLLAHRRKSCGDDGGGASPTLGYTFGAYPWSEQNFFYTWLSATGENIAPDWPHSAWLANYVIWNWIDGATAPLEYGYGDAQHTGNGLPTWQLYTHMANIRHLYGEQLPQAAALARHLQETLPAKQQVYSSTWFIYPFLLADQEASPAALPLESLPHARNFEAMGQLFMRSATGYGATCCLFTCGGVLAQHRHYDALNFVIYHRGFLALDSGTRYSETANGQHLKNYYAQTVAHNCVLIHQPGEPPASYWGEGPAVAANHGGQHHQLGSETKAFETNDLFVYVAGDATACYQHKQPDGLAQKTRLVTRQLVFLMPNHFVIFDRVNATDPSYQKQWLLHTAREPVIEGQTIRATHGEGALLCRTLLPDDAVLEPVGGPGKEFWAAGKNWDIETGKLGEDALDIMGRWRVEISPGAPREDDVFLHVIQVGDQSLVEMDTPSLIETEDMAGARITIGGRTWEVTFSKQGDLGGHIRLTGEGESLDRPLTTEVTPQVGILAATE